jgi:hypothetical protein
MSLQVDLQLQDTLALLLRCGVITERADSSGSSSRVCYQLRPLGAAVAGLSAQSLLQHQAPALDALRSAGVGPGRLQGAAGDGHGGWLGARWRRTRAAVAGSSSSSSSSSSSHSSCGRVQQQAVTQPSSEAAAGTDSKAGRVSALPSRHVHVHNGPRMWARRRSSSSSSGRCSGGGGVGRSGRAGFGVVHAVGGRWAL